MFDIAELEKRKYDPLLLFIQIILWKLCKTNKIQNKNKRIISMLGGL